VVGVVHQRFRVEPGHRHGSPGRQQAYSRAGGRRLPQMRYSGDASSTVPPCLHTTPALRPSSSRRTSTTRSGHASPS
jgi:hypothetical protein